MCRDHISQLIVSLVRESLDLSAIIGATEAGWGSRRSIRG